MSTLARSTPQIALERPGSLKDAAYRQIKDLLLSGQLAHDRLYSAQHFAERLGISRTPAREALLALAGEGLLVCLDVRGFKVKEFSTKEIQDVFETRQIIESYVFHRLVDDHTNDDLKQMERALKTMAEHARKKDELAFLEADKEFHSVPLRRCGNLHLLAIMENIRNHIAILSRKALGYEGRYQGVLREHAAILDALRRRDKKKAAQAVREHLTTTEQYWLGKEQRAEKE